MKCRKAHLEDLDIIFKIEQKLFNQPWTKKSIYNELNRSKNTLNLVAEIDKKIIGYFFSHFFEGNKMSLECNFKAVDGVCSTRLKYFRNYRS